MDGSHDEMEGFSKIFIKIKLSRKPADLAPRVVVNFTQQEPGAVGGATSSRRDCDKLFMHRLLYLQLLSCSQC